MIEQVVEILTLVALLVPFIYLSKVVADLRTKVALLEAEIELVLILLKRR